MITFHSLPTTATPRFSLAWQLYEEAFPPAERRSLEQQQELLTTPAYHFCSLAIEEGTVLGILGYWTFPAFTFLEHLAVSPAMQGRGIGKEALHHLIKEVQKPMVLEVEPPTTEVASRRINFYTRAGFNLISFPYQQPPYGTDKPWVPLQLMSFPFDLAKVSFDSVVQLLYREVYGVK